jgi:hypothetical protein
MSPWWQARREAFLARHLAQAKAHHEPLLDANGEPTRRHLALIMWAYSPDPAKLKSARLSNPIIPTSSSYPATGGETKCRG